VSQLEEGSARQSLVGANFSFMLDAKHSSEHAECSQSTRCDRIRFVVQNRPMRDAWQMRNRDSATNAAAMIVFVNAHKNSSWLVASP
jgi:hypothetical protein